MTFHSPPKSEDVGSTGSEDAVERAISPTTSPRTRDTAALTFAPSARVLRRSRHEIQIERAGRAVVVSNLPDSVVAQLSGKSPRPSATGPAEHECSHPAADLEPEGDAAPSHGSPNPSDDQERADEAEVSRVLRTLASAGYLSTTPPGGPIARPITARDVALHPDLVSLDDRFGTRAPTVLDRRRYRYVRIHGTGRLAPLVAALLAAAGVGRILAPDSADVTMSDAVPGGLRPEDEGQRTAAAVANAIRRARAGPAPTTSFTEVADLVIAAEGHPVRPHLRAALHSDRGPHLITGVWGPSGVIGPLVLPGRTSCLSCADLHRSDRDPAWPALAAQLNGPPERTIPSEVAVCALTAAITAVQALAFLDGEWPATLDGTLEFRLPDWRVRRRHWSRHAGCSCAA